jgi:hypothetical protein
MPCRKYSNREKLVLLSKVQSLVEEGCEKGKVCRDLSLQLSRVQRWEKNAEALEKANPKAFLYVKARNHSLNHSKMTF